MSNPLQDFHEPEIHSDVETLRHSCAHIMAHAIQRLWPETKFGIGPTIENGFYYDIDLDRKLSPEDLRLIEKEMKKITKENKPFVQEEHSVDEAISFFKEQDQPFKVEIIETLRNETCVENVTYFREGDFVDLCRGPHVEKTGKIHYFKLLSVAGAYWRGNEKNPQLQRVYGTAFLTKEDLKEHLHMLEEAKKRDHRKLGRELDLFSFHPESPAAPFFHPKGAQVYQALEQYVRSIYRVTGYEETITPQIMDVDLWHKSGHYENYRENMYFTRTEDEREYAVKPMNCPGSTFIYSSLKRSYRDLPLRLADFGRLHRYERSGATGGLTRVRSFCQDDAHVFCTLEQIELEIKNVVQMILKTYELFHFDEVKIYLSTRPEKRVGSDEVWEQAEEALKKVLDALGRPYEINPGDGAFYGPKIDFNVRDALKRYHQLGTIQLDFNLPERFDLKYTGADNHTHRPVMVHRAVLGSIERFMGILIEHVAGAFPFWLAPVQTRLVAITDAHVEYCHKFSQELRELGYRVEVDDRNESMGLKTREAQKAKIPFSLVVGDREMEEGSFSVRRYGERDSETLSQGDVLKRFQELRDEPNRFVREMTHTR
jgi:threonyl-tRNA synthetase